MPPVRTELKIEKQDFQVRDKMILPFVLLVANSATVSGSYVAGARTEGRRALQGHLVSHLPATTSCSLPTGRASPVWTHPSHQHSRGKQQVPKESSSLLIHHFAAK